MAIYRTIQMSFWTDTKVVDSFTPEDKYFYLYLMTNPHTNLCGCYEVSMKQISDETGYTKETVERLIERMEETHKVIRYSKQSKEILILSSRKNTNYGYVALNDRYSQLVMQSGACNPSRLSYPRC